MIMITKKVIGAVREWLRPEGRAFFCEILLLHGKINAVYMEGNIPHPVHFREGMQIRNFLRGLEDCKEWTAHDYDDNWIEIVEKAIVEDYKEIEKEHSKPVEINDEN